MVYMQKILFSDLRKKLHDDNVRKRRTTSMSQKKRGNLGPGSKQREVISKMLRPYSVKSARRHICEVYNEDGEQHIRVLIEMHPELEALMDVPIKKVPENDWLKIVRYFSNHG